MKSNLQLTQLFEAQSSTYTYLIADPETHTAIIIDPVDETLDRDLKWIQESGCQLKWILETHVHADHVTSAADLREKTGAQIAISEHSGAVGADRYLKDGDFIEAGSIRLKAIATPGHTNGCMSFYGHGWLFSGDALLIRGNGRTDFQQGSSEVLYQSVTQKLFTLADDVIVYPAHDYKGITSSTIGLEKKWNGRLGQNRGLEEFKKIMAELKLALPKRIDEAVPANLKLGKREPSPTVFHPHWNGAVPEVEPRDVQEKLGQSFRLVDVRRADEFTGELGHVAGAELVTLGPDLMRFLSESDRNQEIVFVCRSGGRSAEATLLSRDYGFKKTWNLSGGMLRWNQLGFPVRRTVS